MNFYVLNFKLINLGEGTRGDSGAAGGRARQVATDPRQEAARPDRHRRRQQRRFRPDGRSAQNTAPQEIKGLFTLSKRESECECDIPWGRHFCSS